MLAGLDVSLFDVGVVFSECSVMLVNFSEFIVDCCNVIKLNFRATTT